MDRRPRDFCYDGRDGNDGSGAKGCWGENDDDWYGILKYACGVRKIFFFVESRMH